MARIVKEPIPRQVSCDKCRAVIEYLPEEVHEHNGTDYGGGPNGFKRVKCPRERCPGFGYIDSW